MTAISFGLGSWILAAIMKYTGEKMLNCMPEFGEGEEALASSAAVKSGEAFKRKGTTTEEEEVVGESDNSYRYS